MTRRVHIAIDGPVAAGKGTIASILAQKLNILYIDTGAMYRAVALLAQQSDVDWADQEAVISLIKNHAITAQKPHDGTHGCDIMVDGDRVTDHLRTPQMSKGASIVAKHPKVREYLVAIQQKIAKDKSVVMEGRDITSVVLPDADYKIYLTAEPETRAKRRHIQEVAKDPSVTYEEILKQTIDRDKRDTKRTSSPLTIVEDAIVVDTTDMNIEQVVEHIERIIK